MVLNFSVPGVYLRHTLVAITLLLGFLALAWSFVDSYRDLQRSLAKEALGHLEMEYELIQTYQGNLARQVVDDNFRNPEVLSLLARAAETSDAEELAGIRDDLYLQLLPVYERMKRNGFCQLHFHLPDAVSFLRFHRPGMHGDSLWDVREGLRLAHSTRTAVSGFEEGRIVNGFRHIFPLEHEGRFVGTVEASFSFMTYLMHHVGLDHGLYRLLISDELVESKVWPEEKQRNYGSAPFHPGFARDLRVDPFAHPELLPPGDWSKERVERLDAAVAESVRHRMPEWQPFSVVTRTPAPVIISFMPIETIADRPGGYILRYYEVPEIARAWSFLWWKLLVASVLLLLVFAVLAVLYRRERRGAQLREYLLNDLREEHDNLERAQDIAHIGNWVSDARTGRITWSDGIYAIFGYSPGDFRPTHERFMEAVHPDDRARVEEAVSHSFRTGDPYEIEHRIVRPDGEIRHVLERGMMEMDDAGTLVRMIGTVQDVTELRRFEETRMEAAAIIESTHEAIFVADATGRIVRTNASFQREAGLDVDELQGRRAESLFERSDDRRGDDFAVAWAKAQDQGAWEGELTLVGRSGRRVPVLLSLTSLTLDWGERRIVGLFSDISGIYAREQLMWHKAHHDPLTGAANRVLFRERLTRAIAEAERHEELVGVLYVDLDGFKPVNDNYGHEAGDEVLRTVVRRLNEATRETDTVARLGGDEMAVLLVRPATLEDVERVAEKLREAIARPIDWGSDSIRTSASIGVAIHPRDGANADELLRVADEAMYREKRRHRAASRTSSGTS
ncbi:diguanylate cyclase domain-containing protein [Guyparkeria sp.]|uniref:diguanylate cyclase domain-containing protein n=1 Tax=Guyparkeria sp. TaxID=2035736 RepID=UPI0035658C22